MTYDLPNSVRYIKNGKGGKWWAAAKADGKVYLGWDIPHTLLATRDVAAIEPLIRSQYSHKGSATRDFNAFLYLLNNPSHHLWITFEKEFMWWCTVRDGIETNPNSETTVRGYCWVNCVLPWSNRSIDGLRPLAMKDLPATVTVTAGYNATSCNHKGAKEVLRIICNE